MSHNYSSDNPKWLNYLNLTMFFSSFLSIIPVDVQTDSEEVVFEEAEFGQEAEWG